MSARLPYYDAMDEMKRLKEINTVDLHQVLMVDCKLPGKK